MNMELTIVEAGFRAFAVVDTEKGAIDAAERLRPVPILTPRGPMLRVEQGA